MRRIEIIHESLLAAWPRLVRWQAQDHEGALLRDQLRQSAQAWEERGRPDDLLWIGSAYKDFDAWRERYRGGLTKTEAAFAAAMIAHAGRRRRRRRLAIATGFALLAIGLAILAAFWLRAEKSGEEARAAAASAEASALLALGRPQLEPSPTNALAYAIAALERDDGPAARRFALEALAAGPIALLPEPDSDVPTLPWSAEISPDGEWLAAGFESGEVWMWPRRGGPGRLLARREDGPVRGVGFSSDSRLLVTRAQPSHEIEVWSIPSGGRVRNLSSSVPTDFRLTGDPQVLLTFEATGATTRVVRRTLLEDDAATLTEIPSSMTAWGQWPVAWPLEVDLTNRRVAWAPYAYSGDNVVFIADLDDVSATKRVITTPSELVTGVALDPDGRHLFTVDIGGVVRRFDLTGPGTLERSLRVGRSSLFRPLFDRDGRRLVMGTGQDGVLLVDLGAPWDAAPQSFRASGSRKFYDVRFGPEDRWLVGAGDAGLALWPTQRPLSMRLGGHTARIQRLRFLPDGSALVSTSSDGTLRLWPLTDADQPGRVLFEETIELSQVAPDPAGDNLLVGAMDGRFWILPLQGGDPEFVIDFDGNAQGHAFGTEHVAVSGGTFQQQDLFILNLETGESAYHELGWTITGLALTPSDELLLGRPDGIFEFQSDGTLQPLIEGDDLGGWDLTPDGRYLLVGHRGRTRPAVIHDLVEGTSVELTEFGPGYLGLLSANGRVAFAGWSSPYEAIGRPGTVPHRFPDSAPKAAKAALSPDGRWVAYVRDDDDTTIRLWPVPDLSRPPLHTLPREELLAKLRTHTNLRVVSDPESDTGWSYDLAPFQGWEELPEW